jgi:hypothetical protein
MPLLDTDMRLPRRVTAVLVAALVAMALVGAVAASISAGERRGRHGGDVASVQAVRYVGG